MRRYQLDWAGPQFKSMSVDQHVQFAMTDQRDQVASYLKKGGLPPVFGEWALAGAFTGLCAVRTHVMAGVMQCPCRWPWRGSTSCPAFVYISNAQH